MRARIVRDARPCGPRPSTRLSCSDVDQPHTIPRHRNRSGLVHLAVAQTTRALDFDGDGRPDLTYVRSTTFDWNTLRSGTGFTTNTSKQWGLPGDLPAAGDYDGDGIADPAVLRPSSGAWYVTASSLGGGSFLLVPGFAGGTVPVPADYDGDGQTDLAAYYPPTGAWRVLRSTKGYAFDERLQIQWGLPGDVPVAGDYDGDGRADPAVYRPSNGTWYVLQSSTGPGGL
jgi:hypothetical protein